MKEVDVDENLELRFLDYFLVNSNNKKTSDENKAASDIQMSAPIVEK